MYEAFQSVLKECGCIIISHRLASAKPADKIVEIAKEKTAIIISHRIGLCKFVDKIIVMKNGEIAEIWTHNDLIAFQGKYNRLFTEQGKWYK